MTLHVRNGDGTSKYLKTRGAGTETDPFLPQQVMGSNGMSLDAWGRQKVVHDHSLFHGMWTFSVPNRVWKMLVDTGAGFVEQSAIDNSYVRSFDGYLQVTGDATQDTQLQSKRHPRYQPNRGLLYSSAWVLPSPNAVGTRMFGFCGADSGIYYELIGSGAAYVLNVVRRTTEGGVTTDHKTDITSSLPVGFDISKGHVYDIQIQHRGVGNYMFFVDLELVYTEELLGTLTGLGVWNPAFHVGAAVTGAAATMVMDCGCVDVTSEGGTVENKLYSTVTTGASLIGAAAGVDTAILGIRIPEVVSYHSHVMEYTRDMLLAMLSSFCKDEAFVSVYVARSVVAVTLEALTWVQSLDSLYEYLVGGTASALHTAFATDKASMINHFSIRQEKDIAMHKDNPLPEQSNLYLTPGDIIVFSIQPDGTTTAGMTVELAEEV